MAAVQTAQQDALYNISQIVLLDCSISGKFVGALCSRYEIGWLEIGWRAWRGMCELRAEGDAGSHCFVGRQ